MTTLPLTHPEAVPLPTLHRAPYLTPVDRVIRAPEFIGRARPLNLGALLAPLLVSCPDQRPEALVVALAEEMRARSLKSIPKRWLEKLAGALQVDRQRVRIPAGVFDDLPRPAWSDPALLGEWLNATRQHADLKQRSGG